MEQRRLRLGDILDDYCPRERRVTNHAVVAMIGEDVKQTRCTTCDAEHAFKGAREPRRRKKDAQAVLYSQVLAGLPEADLAVAGALPIEAAALVAPAIRPPEIDADPDEDDEEDAEELDAMADANDDESEDAIDGVVEDDAVQEDDGVAPPVEEGPVHRRLIRATLPRPEGVAKEPRQVTEFTMRSNPRGGFRGGAFRGNGGGTGSGTGNGQANRGRRFAGGGPSRGGGGGFRGGSNPQRPGGGGKKRSR